MKLLYYFAWSSLGLMYRFYFRWSVYHPERVPVRGPVILACNHASFLDPALVGCALPREVCYLGRESLFRYPVVGTVLRGVNAVPVDRDGGGAAGLKAILERLRDGFAILLFPEGTRTTDGRLQPARAGIGLMVIKSGAPVVPVRVYGTLAAYNRKTLFPRPHRLAVKFGRPMDFAALRVEAESAPKPRLKQIYQLVADEIMAEIGKLEPCRDCESFP